MNEKKLKMTLPSLYKMCDTLGQNSAIALEQKTLDEWFESMVGFRTALSNYHYGKLYRKLETLLENVTLNFDETVRDKSDLLIWLNETLEDTLSKTLNRILNDSTGNSTDDGENLSKSALHDAQRRFYNDLKNVIIVEGS